MFLEISPHEGVFDSYIEYRNELKPLATSYRLNLHLVRKVFFGEKEIYHFREGYLFYKKITFEVMTSGNGNENITLYFEEDSKEAQGEYQRINRVMDDNTWR
jgi:hypothetical protein